MAVAAVATARLLAEAMALLLVALRVAGTISVLFALLLNYHLNSIL